MSKKDPFQVKTPESLSETLKEFIQEDKLVHVRKTVKDFIAQRFTMAIGAAETPEEEARLRKLFREISE